MVRWRRRRREPEPPRLEVRRGLPLINKSYEGRPPFQVQFLHESRHPGMIEIRQSSELRGAVIVFFDLGWPQIPGWVGSITDATRRRVLVWDSSDDMVDVFGPTGAWWATDRVFELMDELDVATPVDRAVWETMSKEMTW